jgi:hypothetical protein
MAGQIQLNAKYYPSDFNVATSAMIVIPASGVTAVPLLYSDRNLIIDSVTMYLFGGVAITTNSLNCKIKWVAGATAPTFATATQDVATFAALAPGTTAASTLTPTFGTTNGALNNNIVPADSWVWFQTNAAGSITNTPTVVIQIRYRSQF